jgi:preprotein translocase subunit SecD
MRPYNIVEPARRLVNGIGKFFRQLKKYHLIKFHSFFHEQKSWHILSVDHILDYMQIAENEHYNVSFNCRHVLGSNRWNEITRYAVGKGLAISAELKS